MVQVHHRSPQWGFLGYVRHPAVVDRYLPWSGMVPGRCRVPGAEADRLRSEQEEPIADVDPGSLREDE